MHNLLTAPCRRCQHSLLIPGSSQSIVHGQQLPMQIRLSWRQCRTITKKASLTFSFQLSLSLLSFRLPFLHWLKMIVVILAGDLMMRWLSHTSRLCLLSSVACYTQKQPTHLRGLQWSRSSWWVYWQACLRAQAQVPSSALKTWPGRYGPQHAVQCLLASCTI